MTTPFPLDSARFHHDRGGEEIVKADSGTYEDRLLHVLLATAHYTAGQLVLAIAAAGRDAEDA